MHGDPSTQREFEDHLVQHTGCIARLNENSGDVVPVALCPEGDALRFAAQWDADAAHLRRMQENRI